MKRSSVLLVAIVGLFLTGCPEQGPPAVKTTPVIGGRPVSLDRRGPAERAAKKNYILLVRLRLASVEVPVGKASGTEELWSYLDEEPVAAVHGVSLGLNGVRIGIGRKDAWPDVVKALQKMTGRKLKESTMVTLPGGTVPIELKKRARVETIFAFYGDRTLSGADYPPGDYLLTVSSTVSEDDPSQAVLTGLPQIRTAKREAQFVTRGGRVTIVMRPKILSFRQLTFQVTVAQKDFLVIGPGTEARRPNSVGHHFFGKSKNGLEFETVLIVIPEVFAAPIKPAKLPGNGPRSGGPAG